MIIVTGRQRVKANQSDSNTVNSKNFARVLISHETSHMRSFVKIKSLRNGKIILSFTDIGKSCPSREF